LAPNYDCGQSTPLEGVLPYLIAPPQPVSLSGIMYDHDIQMLVNTERGVLARGCGMYLETGKSESVYENLYFVQI